MCFDELNPHPQDIKIGVVPYCLHTSHPSFCQRSITNMSESSSNGLPDLTPAALGINLNTTLGAVFIGFTVSAVLSFFQSLETLLLAKL